jgi:hypothetical protein
LENEGGDDVGQRTNTRMRHRAVDNGLVLLIACACAALVTSVGLGAATSAPGAAATGSVVAASKSGIAGWTEVGSYDENTLGAGEGVATVSTSGLGSHELYRGIQSVPGNLSAQGWSHIGDPDSARGYIFDAYQGPSSGNTKMFLVTTPAGKSFEYVHTLVHGELYNNSFAAVSPNAQWMVAGEWRTMSHLQIYPTPLLNRKTSPGGGALRLAGYIKLDHKVNDIQGCDFVTPQRLICASDDDSDTLFPNQKPLLEVTLPESLHGANEKAHVVDLGSIPQKSTCSGTFEAEGVDFDTSTRTLRVEIIQPGSCILMTTITEYELADTRR